MEIVSVWNERHVRDLQARIAPRQFAFVLSLGINKIGQRVKANETDVMQARLDRPTAFTRRSLRLQAGNKRNPSARVWFKGRDFGAQKGTPAGDYLMPQVHGGPRRGKRLEGALLRLGHLRSGQFLVPAPGAPRDAYGNVPRTLITRIMSGLRAFSEVGFAANASGSRRSRRKGNASRYFVGEVGGETGIWERREFAFGRGVRPIFLVINRTPRYRVRFPFFAVAENTVKAHYVRELDSAFEYAMRTARPEHA